jgi:hypothetical protein
LRAGSQLASTKLKQTIGPSRIVTSRRSDPAWSDATARYRNHRFIEYSPFVWPLLHRRSIAMRTEIHLLSKLPISKRGQRKGPPHCQVSSRRIRAARIHSDRYPPHKGWSVKTLNFGTSDPSRHHARVTPFSFLSRFTSVAESLTALAYRSGASLDNLVGSSLLEDDEHRERP